MEQRHKHTLTFIVVLFIVLSLMYLSGHHDHHHYTESDEPWESSVKYDIVMEDEQGNVLHNYGEADLGGID